jgi:acyl-[acyl carrier protein]--UDP-N-acetylglucosamine O-acyltransferase
MLLLNSRNRCGMQPRSLDFERAIALREQVKNLYERLKEGEKKSLEK